MKKRKSTLICLFFSFVIFVGLVSVLIFTNKIDKLTENDITEYEATVIKTQIVDTNNLINVNIFTDEYDNYWYVSSVISLHIDDDYIRNLKFGDTIVVGVNNDSIHDINNSIFVDIVSLKTSEKEVFSLQQYNEYVSQVAVFPRIVAGFVALFALGISLCCVLKLKRQHTIVDKEDKQLRDNFNVKR